MVGHAGFAPRSQGHQHMARWIHLDDDIGGGVHGPDIALRVHADLMGAAIAAAGRSIHGLIARFGWIAVLLGHRHHFAGFEFPSPPGTNKPAIMLVYKNKKITRVDYQVFAVL